jgi:hypothetical protein
MTGVQKKFKYCSYYGCGYLLPNDFDPKEKCPNCGHKTYDWERKEWIKPLPPEAYEVEMKCKEKDCTCEDVKPEDLRYRETNDYGSFKTGNEFECRTCKEAWDVEYARQEAMNYIIINEDNETGEFYEDKAAVESMFEDFLKDYWSEGENPFDDWVILKVEKIPDNHVKKKHFEKRNVLQYDYEWYVVEEVIEPEYEYSGDHSVSW